MIIVFTGNGKGKTTAALGQVFRTLGRGKKALVIQFIKGPWKSGEDELVRKIKNHGDSLESIPEELENLFNLKIKKKGLGFVGILGDSLPLEDHQRSAKEALDLFEKSWADYELVVLDELNVALSLDLVTIDEVLLALDKVPAEKFVICTGRGAPQKLIDASHLATEMKEIKHPFNDGKLAQIAFEF
jgi:cob(I)alamin adenosyltransferase